MAKADITNRKRHLATYSSWGGMKNRCDNPNNPKYYRYGGRGISYVERWANFQNFWEDMGKRKDGCSLDRIDNNGNYSKENCRWATYKEQANNTRRNRLVTYQNQTKNLSQWATYFGIKSSTFRQRFYVYKWSFGNCIKT